MQEIVHKYRKPTEKVTCFCHRKHGLGETTPNHPEWDAYGMLTSGAIMWYLVFYEIYYYEILNANFPPNFKIVGFVICVLILTVFYFLFLYKEKYKKIYFKFNHLNLKQRKQGLIISLFYLFLPILIGAYITLRWHRII